MSFVGRKKELSLLKDLLDLKKSSLVTVQGRRRIGKSTLIKEFARRQKITFYEFQGLAPRSGLTNQDQLNHFGETLAGYLGMANIHFESWGQALAGLNNLVTKKGPTLILLDEISWAGGKDNDFAGKLKDQWDRTLSLNTNLILVLCGSVSSWIEENILKNSGFAGRVSLELHLKELSIAESKELLSSQRQGKITTNDLAQYLCVTGGVPKYLEEIATNYPVQDNIFKLCFESSGILFTEFDRIFSEVFGRRHLTYTKILLTLRDGPKEPSEVAKAIGHPINSDFTNYLTDLNLGGFIRRDYTWNFHGSLSRLSQLRISDNYTRFYLKYIYPRKDKIMKHPFPREQGLVLLNWNSIMGIQFESLILNNLTTLIPKIRINESEIIQIGPYFQNRTKRLPGVQIDLLILTNKKVIHQVEIKSGPIVKKGIIDEVREKNKRLKMPKGFSVRNHLIYGGELSDSITEANFFDTLISFEELANG